jgi:hypothetical protein
MPPPQAQPPLRRRHRVRRWTLRAVIALLVLVVLAVVAITIVLNTEIPRRLVLTSLQRQLGLRGEAEALSTWWWGDTVLENVTLALPLADEALLEVEQLRVDHTNLPFILLGRPLRVHEVKLVRPRLVVRQDALGRWNVAEALALIGRASGGQSAANEERRGEAVQLPVVDLIDGTLLLINNKDQQVTLAPLEVQGRPENPLAWKFRATVLPRIEIEGRVAPGQRWNHQADIRVRQIGDVIRPWVTAWPDPFEIAGEWSGEVIEGVATGRLDLKKAQVAAVNATGSVGLEAGAGSATVRPQAMAIKIGTTEPTPVQLMGGSFQTSGSQVKAEEVRVGVFGGTARLAGQFDWHLMSGRMDLSWIDLALPGDIRHEGRVSATLDTPWAGRPQIKAEAASAGVSPRGKWEGAFTVRGEGRSWRDIDWTLVAPEIAWRDAKLNYTVRQVTARATTTDSVVRLVDLRIPETDRLAGTGRWDVETGEWDLKMAMRGVPLPRVPQPSDISFVAAGGQKRVDVPSFIFRSGAFVAETAAAYVFDDPKPLSAVVAMSRPPFVIEGDAEALARGVLRGEAAIVGTLGPLRLETKLQVFGNDVHFGKRDLGDLTVQLAGFIDPAGVRVDSQEIELLEGHWTLWAEYVFGDGTTRAGLDVRDLSLRQADALFTPPPKAEGTLLAEMRLDIPEGDRSRLAVRGDWLVRNLNTSGLRADGVAGSITVDETLLRLDDIRFRYLDGRGRASLEYDLRDRTKLSVQAAVETWPIETEDGTFATDVTADATLDVDLKEMAATGPLNLTGPVRAWGDDVGLFRIASAMEGRELFLKEITANAFEGEIGGEARFNFDDWLNGTAKVEWKNVETGPLVELFPDLEGLNGAMSGTLVAAKPIDPKTPEPLRVQISLASNGARMNGMSIGDAGIVFLLGRDHAGNAPRADRIILDRSTFQLAGGTVNAWGRTSTHAGSYFHTLHMQIAMNRLSLDELVHALEPEAEPMIGVLSGEITAFGPRRDYKLMNGEVTLRLTESELANSDIINAFYQVFNFGRGDAGPTGEGTAHMRLENGSLQITGLRYRARGIQVRGSGAVEDVFLKQGSPISGYAVGTVRPLRDIKLPYMAQVDDVLAALQTDVTTFRIGGTVRDPKVETGAFNEIGGTLRRLILGDVEAETRGSAGR